jgi:hypothetical protein
MFFRQRQMGRKEAGTFEKQEFLHTFWSAIRGNKYEFHKPTINLL